LAAVYEIAGSKPAITQQQQPLFYGHCFGKHLQLRMGVFVGAKFYCPHALATTPAMSSVTDLSAVYRLT